MTNDTATYRAVQTVAPGRLELTTKPLREPPPGYVRIRVEACGVCHSDAGTVAGTFPIWDVLFGTFRMPEGRLPESYGKDEAAMPSEITSATLVRNSEGICDLYVCNWLRRGS